MQEKLKELGGKIKGFLAKISKKAWIIIGCALGVVIAAIVGLAVFMNSRPYAVLFTGLSTEEVTAITSYLNSTEGASFKVEGTDTILVPEAQEAQLKANLLMQGYPKSGFAYETYRAGVGSMSTDSDRQMAYLQDLQDRMAGVIRCMDGVQSAVVTIAEGEDRRYVLDSSNVVDASAAVMVTMSGGGTLAKQQAEAIRNLVAHAVQGLDIGNIAISDSQGNTYDSAGDVGAASDASELKLQLEEQTNNRVRGQILSVLTPFYGEENVRVAVSSTVDVDHTVGESTAYTLPAWAADGQTGGEGIIGSKIYDQEVIRGQDGAVGGVVGNDTNADISQYAENAAKVNGDENYIKNQGEVHYSTDTQTTQKEHIAGYVADLMVSVSINSAASGAVNTSELLSHIARAANITPDVQADKISILLAPFYDPNANIVPTPVGVLNLPTWALYAAIGGAALLLVLLILLLLLRRKKKKKRAEEEEIANMLNAAQNAGMTEVAPAEGGGADIMTVRTERSIQLRQEIRKFAEENPELAAHMLRTWLRGGDEDEN